MIAETPARRVRHLRLAAPDEALARRGALLVEDALRTATLPGGNDGRLIVVRSLALGKIDSRGSPASVALALEQSWHRLAASAVHAEDPAAPHQPAVYFRDRVEALTLLAGRLAVGREADAWFWPLAVPGWRSGMANGDALRAVLVAALRGASPAAAVLGLAAALIDRGALAPLLAALRPDDGPALLAALGLTRPASPTPRRAADAMLPPLSPVWTSILARWIGAWGTLDVRSTWLAALALAVDAPARLLDPALIFRAEHLASRLAQGEPIPAATQPPAATPHKTAPRALPTAERTTAIEGGSQPPPADRVAEPKTPAHDDRRAAAPGIPAHDKLRLAAPARIAAEQPALAAARADPAAPLPTPEASYTRFAGLALALPLLARLGIADALEADPKLADLELPGRALAALARGARIPADDPIRALFPRPGRWRGACPFTAPSAWQAGLTKGGSATVRGMSGRPEVRVLCEADGRLALALWHGDQPLDDSAPLPRRSDVAVLVEAWQVAAQRWLAAYAGITPGGLIRRPGYIAHTRTHLDVYFSLREADIRVRRAGLDLDPGWLPWYGRVVLFHYAHMPWAAERG